MKMLKTVGIILILLAISYALIPHHSTQQAPGNPIRQSIQTAYDFFGLLQWSLGAVLAICLAGWAAYSTHTIPRQMVNHWLLNPLRWMAARFTDLTQSDDERELGELREVVARLKADEEMKATSRGKPTSPMEG